MPSALITGGTRGFGKALAHRLVREGWQVSITGRDPETLADALGETPGLAGVAGDVADPSHRRLLARMVGPELDLLVNNASSLGATPLPRFAHTDADIVRSVLDTNVVAPLALTRLLLPALHRRHGTVVNLSSDAAVEAYAGWGTYGASKAALDHVTAVFAAEENGVRFYAFDPGDMRTDMHQAAFPGEDISDRPLPETVVPALIRLLGSGLPSGRYRATDLLAEAVL